MERISERKSGDLGDLIYCHQPPAFLGSSLEDSSESEPVQLISIKSPFSFPSTKDLFVSSCPFPGDYQSKDRISESFLERRRLNYVIQVSFLPLRSRVEGHGFCLLRFGFFTFSSPRVCNSLGVLRSGISFSGWCCCVVLVIILIQFRVFLPFSLLFAQHQLTKHTCRGGGLVALFPFYSTPCQLNCSKVRFTVSLVAKRKALHLGVPPTQYSRTFHFSVRLPLTTLSTTCVPVVLCTTRWVTITLFYYSINM